MARQLLKQSSGKLKNPVSYFLVSITFIAIISALFMLPACSGNQTPTTTATTTTTSNLEQEFSLSTGQTASINNENLNIKFIEVTSDSRCPKDVQCIWAGEVNCLVEITKDNLSPSRMVLTHPGLSTQSETQKYNGYDIRFRVEPYPISGKQISQAEYNLYLTVTKGSQPGEEINPAPIDDLKIAVTISTPREVLVYIQGGLKDTCTSFNDLNTQRTGNNITIKVNVKTTTGLMCGQVYTFFEKCVNLGSDFVSGQTYSVTVNDKTTTFTMP